jgi:hypothetical protein
MQNRKLVLIAIVAIGAAAAAHFRSPTWKRRHPAGLSTASANVPVKPKSVSPPHSKPVESQTVPAEKALVELRELLAADPTDQYGHAADLLNDICRTGQFETALKLVDAVPRDLRSDWLKIIFNRWAQNQPRDAMKSLDSIADAGERAGAFHAAVAGWNSHDPAGLADYAIDLLATDDRDYALAQALDNWSLQDPVALATWLNTLPRGSEFDYGAAMMIARTDGANRSPELAMKWVENIEDPALKQNSFARILGQWLQTDSAAAKQYVNTASWIDDPFRSKILSTLSQRR